MPHRALHWVENHGRAEVVQEEVAWLGYRGNWGSCLAPNEQGWWKTAECPVSRGGFLRAVGEFWPERKRA